MKSKYCEWCGKNSASFIYRFLARVDYFIHLDSPRIKQIDLKNDEVILDGGQKISFSAKMSSEAAISFSELIPHIFCSEGCEDAFLSKYQGFFRNDVPTITAITEFKQNEFVPVSFPIENINCSTSSCAQCGEKFPNISKSQTIYRILSSAVENGDLSSGPKKADTYPIIFSDMHPTRPQGKYYYLNPDMKNPTKGIFCSNDCTYDYAKEKNVFIIQKNILMENNLTAISPFTIDINRGLSNPNIFRPQIMRR